MCIDHYASGLLNVLPLSYIVPFGGTCALRGCDPKKVLVEAARVIDSNQRHESKGIIGSDAVHIKLSDLIRFERTFTDPFQENREDSYINAGIASRLLLLYFGNR